MKQKILWECHSLYVQGDILLLADVFENFWNICHEICELDSNYLLFALGWAWQAVLKKTKVKLGLPADINMLLMVEEGIIFGICHVIHWYAKANNKYMKNYDKNKESSYLKYCHVNNLYGWEMSQKLLLDGFKWFEETSQFNEDFI